MFKHHTPVSTKLSILRRIASIFLAITVALFWSGYFLNRRLGRELTVARIDSPVPPLINGLRVSFDGTQRIDSLSSTLGQSRANVLVVAIADACPLTRSLAPKLAALFEMPALSAVDGVVVVTFDGVQLASELRQTMQARSLAVEVRRVTDRDTFVRSSGIVETPTIMLVDGQRRVRFATSGLAPGANMVLAEVIVAPHNTGTRR